MHVCSGLDQDSFCLQPSHEPLRSSTSSLKMLGVILVLRARITACLSSLDRASFCLKPSRDPGGGGLGRPRSCRVSLVGARTYLRTHVRTFSYLLAHAQTHERTRTGKSWRVAKPVWCTPSHRASASIFSSFAAAKVACSKLVICTGIYDHGCDGKGRHVLCAGGPNVLGSSSSGSCVHQKPAGEPRPIPPRHTTPNPGCCFAQGEVHASQARIRPRSLFPVSATAIQNCQFQCQ